LLAFEFVENHLDSEFLGYKEHNGSLDNSSDLRGMPCDCISGWAALSPPNSMPASRILRLLCHRRAHRNTVEAIALSRLNDTPKLNVPTVITGGQTSKMRPRALPRCDYVTIHFTGRVRAPSLL